MQAHQLLRGRCISATPVQAHHNIQRCQAQITQQCFRGRTAWQTACLSVNHRRRSWQHSSPNRWQPPTGHRQRQLCQRCYGSAVNRFSAGEEASSTLTEAFSSVVANAQSLYKFARPHTLFGTFISICSVSLLALGPADFGTAALVGLVQALIPALLMNICIVGMNQVYDVDIDRINKPYLPLASGEWDLQTGITTVIITGVLAVLMGVAIGSMPLLITLVGSLLLGIAYSTDVPFLRWKKYPLLAMGCILSVRAVMVQLGFYYHMKEAIGAAHPQMTPPLIFAISFMVLCSVVIALFKDVPDLAGDEQAGVRTLTVRLGVSKVFWTCIVLLELAYAGAVGVGLLSQVWWSRVATVVTHIIMGVLLYLRAKKTDLTSSKAIYDCYMFVWKLFYAEYLFIPLFR